MLQFLQKIGRSLMLPVATLPAAGILRGLALLDYEKDIPLGSTVGGFLNHYIGPLLATGADAIFTNLALIFAVGIAIGMARDAVAALSAVIGYLILVAVLKVIPGMMGYIPDSTELNMGVLGGILVGLWAAYMYNRFHSIKMPDWLGFFSGKRFVPMVTAGSTLVLATLFGMIWSPIQEAISAFGMWVVSLGGIGAFVYGTANRLLVPIGLHHVLNSIVWFQIGDYTNAAGQVVQGDLNRFFAGDKTAGMFMTGFFPIMMFALPGAALAFIHTARPEKRKMVASIFISAAVASFLTGITEPLEFAFMFTAPLLYVVHAVLSGLAGYILFIMNVKLGFSFSAGLIDYLVNMKLSTNPLLMLPVGLAFFVIYYVLFRFLIVKFNLKTPGREDDAADTASNTADSSAAKGQAGESAIASAAVAGANDSKAAQILTHLGGSSNVDSIDACITRLRLVVKDDRQVEDVELRKLGAAGVMRLGSGAVQVIFGTQSEALKDEIKDIMDK